MKKKYPKPPAKKFDIRYVLIPVGVLAGLFFAFRCFLSGNQLDPEIRIGTGISLILLSTCITILLLIAITAVFGFVNFKKGFLNFLIGDNGTYSLSRLQAVLWAIVIISCQFSLVLCLCFNAHGFYFSIYQPVFSESSTWLLGLSLTSYIAVKGITVNQMTNNPSAIVPQKTVPKWGDILTGSNGLDFSKCQMLIWTLLAIIVFESKCYYFNNSMLSGSRDLLVKLMNHFYDEYSSKDKLTDINPFVPFLPWSFVVLMGMSQGVYVGKKLVPTFKLADMKANMQADLQSQTAQLNAKTSNLSLILAKTKPGQNSAIDQASVAAIKQDISATQDQINQLNATINQINNFTQTNQ